MDDLRLNPGVEYSHSTVARRVRFKNESDMQDVEMNIGRIEKQACNNLRKWERLPISAVDQGTNNRDELDD